jgi:hypothetical protein
MGVAARASQDAMSRSNAHSFLKHHAGIYSMTLVEKQASESVATGFDPASTLSAAGAPFEMTHTVIDGGRALVFKNGPRELGDIYRAAANYGSRVFCVYEDTVLTYSDLLRKAAALAGFFSERGVAQRGARIAIAMNNRPEWMITFIAATAAGATVVLINSRGTAAEIDAALAASDAARAPAGRPRRYAPDNYDRRRTGRPALARAVRAGYRELGERRPAAGSAPTG